MTKYRLLCYSSFTLKNNSCDMKSLLYINYNQI